MALAREDLHKCWFFGLKAESGSAEELQGARFVRDRPGERPSDDVARWGRFATMETTTKGNCRSPVRLGGHAKARLFDGRKAHPAGSLFAADLDFCARRRTRDDRRASRSTQGIAQESKSMGDVTLKVKGCQRLIYLFTIRTSIRARGLPKRVRIRWEVYCFEQGA